MALNEEAVRRLVAILRNVSPTDFTMGDWCSAYAVDHKKDCGFAGCALGHATQDEWFKDQGFIMDLYGAPVYDNVLGYMAAVKFFGITYEESLLLFDDKSYSRGVKPDVVAQRLEDFITMGIHAP